MMQQTDIDTLRLLIDMRGDTAMVNKYLPNDDEISQILLTVPADTMRHVEQTKCNFFCIDNDMTEDERWKLRVWRIRAKPKRDITVTTHEFVYSEVLNSPVYIARTTEVIKYVDNNRKS